MDFNPLTAPLKLRRNKSTWLTIALVGQLLFTASAMAGTCTPDPGYSHCQTFSYSGSMQSFTVPAGVTSMDVRLWGAGGGGNAWQNPAVSGGGGGFTSGKLAVSPGEALSITVGQGGQYGQTGIFGGGGNAGSTVDGGAPGGGLSAVATGTPLSTANVLLVAGGGGGGAAGFFGDTSHGGPGGGSNGAAGGAVYGGGTLAGGGTQTAGGVGGTGSHDGSSATAGSLFQGGLGGQLNGVPYSGGGGGGGYYGGGGGADWAGGGGGSGYCASSGVSACSTTAGSGLTPAGTSDPQYQAGIGAGVTGAAGGNGLVVLQWNITPASIPTLSTWGLILLTAILAMIGLFGVRRTMPAAG